MPGKEMESQYCETSQNRESSAVFDHSTHSILQDAYSKQLGAMSEADEEPLTPSSSLSTPDWNGLPSPITPTFDQNQCSSKHNEHEDSGISDDYDQSNSEPKIRTVRANDQYGEQVEISSVSEVNNAANTPSALGTLTQIDQGRISNNLENDGSDIIDLTFKHDVFIRDQSGSMPHQDGSESAHLLGVSVDSTMPLRRSGRIHTLMKEKDNSRKAAATAVTPAKKTTKATKSQSLEQTKKVGASLATDVISFKGLPIPQSVDWELQYPPGGSTHPSYPFPNVDPRLIFHENFVPLSNGLPDIGKVPNLLLPIGWKHVSWFGLFPIAFDPYLQGFKLTPVGPLPLTSEELQQNGLYKYVPGGEYHPETPLLPQITHLSNSSTGDVYNWDGVDWTLPWTEINNALGLPANFANVGDNLNIHGYNLQTDQLNIEGWECPDGIIDVADGWRWLSEIISKPTLTFQPSEGKTRRGTGILRVNRRFKQPIACLMATAIANSADTPELYLVNQDRLEFCPFRSVATPVHINVSLLKGVEITLKELLSYFPSHYHWNKCADRLVKAGLSGSDVAKTINMVRCLSGDAAKKKPTLPTSNSSITRSNSVENTATLGIGNDEESTGYTTENWSYDKWELTDYPLLALSHGLVSLPEGEDAGPLTKTILWCRAKGRHETLLSEVPDLVELAEIENKIQRPASGCPDQTFLPRHTEALTEDRKRVLKVERLKRAAEVAEESKAKRSRKS